MGVGRRWTLVAPMTTGGFFDGYAAVLLSDITRARPYDTWEHRFPRTRPEWPPRSPAGMPAIDLTAPRACWRPSSSRASCSPSNAGSRGTCSGWACRTSSPELVLPLGGQLESRVGPCAKGLQTSNHHTRPDRRPLPPGTNRCRGPSSVRGPPHHWTARSKTGVSDSEVWPAQRSSIESPSGKRAQPAVAARSTLTRWTTGPEDRLER